MSLLDSLKATSIATKAYRIHQDAVKVSDSGNPEEAKKKYTEALELYGQAYDMGMRKINILDTYALLLMREGQLEKARDLMLTIQNLPGLSNTDWYQLRLNYSIYQWKTGQYDKAIETIHRASATMSGAMYNNLGMYLVDKAAASGSFDEALAFMNEAMEYDDEDASTLDNMAFLHLNMYEAAKAAGDKEKAAEYRAKALEYYKKAYNIKPKQITSKYHLAVLLHEDGEDEKARKVLSDVETLYVSYLCPVRREQLLALKKAVG